MACRSFSLTQFNLPVVMSMMKHSWFFFSFFKKSVYSLFSSTSPRALFACDHRTFIIFLSLSFTLLQQCLWAFIVTFSPQHSSGYELHSGILYATYAALCRSRLILKYITYVFIPSLFPSVPKEFHPFPGRRHSDTVLGEWTVHQVPVSASLSLLSISERTFITVYPPNDFP